eukprot:13142328-Heterocapsa_arctica.AAC.1
MHSQCSGDAWDANRHPASAINTPERPLEGNSQEMSDPTNHGWSLLDEHGLETPPIGDPQAFEQWQAWETQPD